jgi:DNA-binding IclR family transcriptional regulator
MKQWRDPAPALTRGLALIRQLSVEGQGTLEHLARRGGWPKSSTLRYLQAMEGAGVVRQDPLSKVWHLRERLAPLELGQGDLLEAWRGRLGGLCQEVGQCLELYRVGAGRVELVDRADPVVRDMQLTARIGFRRDLRECDATALLYYAFSGDKPGGDALSWSWRGGERVRVTARQRAAWLAESRRSGLAVDCEFNENGIRRFAVGLIPADGSLAGIVAVAQRLTPLSARQTGPIREFLSRLKASPPADLAGVAPALNSL